MFGQNIIRKQTQDDGRSLQVAEIFATIQGEGPFTGRRSMFVRLTGCNLRCWFCDTKWDDENDLYRNIDDIVAEAEHRARDAFGAGDYLVVLTGGEPMRQNIFPLIRRFQMLGLRVQIETAGTIWSEELENVRGSNFTIVCSPKTPTIPEKLARFVSQSGYFKYVIKAGEVASDGLPMMNTQNKTGAPKVLARPPLGTLPQQVYLSPCDEYDGEKNKANLRTCVESAMAHGYVCGVQLHKLLHLP